MPLLESFISEPPLHPPGRREPSLRCNYLRCGYLSKLEPSQHSTAQQEKRTIYPLCSPLLYQRNGLIFTKSAAAETSSSRASSPYPSFTNARGTFCICVCVYIRRHSTPPIVRLAVVNLEAIATSARPFPTF